MTLPLVFMVLALVLALFAGYHSWRQLPVSWLLLGGLALLELLLIIQLVLGALALTDPELEVNAAAFIGYLIACVVVPPVGTLWGLGDKSRWGTGVIVIAMITVAALCLRVHTLWSGSPVG